jgi:hypothetical protein
VFVALFLSYARDKSCPKFPLFEIIFIDILQGSLDGDQLVARPTTYTMRHRYRITSRIRICSNLDWKSILDLAVTQDVSRQLPTEAARLRSHRFSYFVRI